MLALHAIPSVILIGIKQWMVRLSLCLIHPENHLFYPNFTFRFPKSHKNPGMGGWISHIWKNFPKKTFFFTFPYLGRCVDRVDGDAGKGGLVRRWASRPRDSSKSPVRLGETWELELTLRKAVKRWKSCKSVNFAKETLLEFQVVLVKKKL